MNFLIFINYFILDLNYLLNKDNIFMKLDNFIINIKMLKMDHHRFILIKIIINQ